MKTLVMKTGGPRFRSECSQEKAKPGNMSTCNVRAGRITQQLMAFAPKPDELSAILKTSIMGEEN